MHPDPSTRRARFWKYPVLAGWFLGCYLLWRSWREGEWDAEHLPYAAGLVLICMLITALWEWLAKANWTWFAAFLRMVLVQMLLSILIVVTLKVLRPE
ncbi:MAG: hypothetical protein ACREJB_14830 [Planctomycetaceae bacterium]